MQRGQLIKNEKFDEAIKIEKEIDMEIKDENKLNKF